MRTLRCHRERAPPRSVKYKRRDPLDRGVHHSLAEPKELATRAVIGTLRPTERRRAKPQLAKLMPTQNSMELRGIEPLTSAVRLQRSPS